MKVLTRELYEAELGEIAKLMRTCTLELSDRLVEHHMGTHDRVMVHKDDNLTRKHSHFRLYREPGTRASFGAGQFYVRMGKRGQRKEYLDRCEVTFLNGKPSLFQFRLRKDR